MIDHLTPIIHLLFDRISILHLYTPCRMSITPSGPVWRALPSRPWSLSKLAWPGAEPRDVGRDGFVRCQPPRGPCRLDPPWDAFGDLETPTLLMNRPHKLSKLRSCPKTKRPETRRSNPVVERGVRLLGPLNIWAGNVLFPLRNGLSSLSCWGPPN